MDWTALDRLTDTFLAVTTIPAAGHGSARPGAGPGATAEVSPDPRSGGSACTGPDAGPGISPGTSPDARSVPLPPATRERLRRALLGLAADALSGPDGLAARLRAALDGTPLTTVSLPLDTGAAAETIPQIGRAHV